MRPFRFGVSIAGFDHGHDWADVARRAEDLGYSTLLVPDHLANQLAPIAAMASAAAVTTTLRVGSFVAAVDFRHPVVLAMELATIDLLSGGRAELGIGAGWRPSEYAMAGIRFDPASIRIERLAEAITVIRRHWRGDPFSFHGTHYDIDGLEGRPLPATPGGPPIFVGGSGPKLLTLAGAMADIVGIAPRRVADGSVTSADVGRQAIEDKLAIVAAAAQGREDPPELNLATLGVAVTDRARTALAGLAARVSLDEDSAATSPHLLVGSIDHITETLLELRAATGLSYITVSAPALATFSPVVARLAGQ